LSSGQEEQKEQTMAEAQSILVVGEVRDGRLSLATAEALAAARHLAGQGRHTVSAGFAGTGLAGAAQEAVQAGAERVYIVEHAVLGTWHIELYLAAVEEICRHTAPSIVLLARTTVGREVAPRLACRLGSSLIQDCLAVEIDPGSGYLTATRPVYGGNILARVRSTATPHMATLRPKAYTALPPDASRQGEIQALSVPLEASMAKITELRREIDTTPGVKLEDARIVVAGGRGLGGPEPFRDLQELAGMLGAGIGASRAAVDAGWVPGNWQIGLTGKTITPELYITVGISGASQHMAGCAGAKTLVAINKDRDANIFRAARYGVVGDWQTVLPAFMQALRDLQ
jgi:electron transfer flavoprotein alpha subunit